MTASVVVFAGVAVAVLVAAAQPAVAATAIGKVTRIQGDATAFLEDMTIVDTERIEVLRGSGSSLYGSHALGGVINVTTRPGGGRTHGEFRAAASLGRTTQGNL